MVQGHYGVGQREMMVLGELLGRMSCLVGGKSDVA
jgi:hypothetical protein